jgi:hypothetical protein
MLTIAALMLAALSLSISAAAQDGRGDIALVEQWLDREAAPSRHSRAWTRWVVAEATPAASSLLIDRHTAAGVPCQACHTPGEAEPADRPLPLSSFDTTCVACHGTMLEPAEGKEMSFPNPHVSPHLSPNEAPPCTECHRVHEPGEVTCNLCHRGFNFTID